MLLEILLHGLQFTLFFRHYCPEPAFTELRMIHQLWVQVRREAITEIEEQKEDIQENVEHIRIMKIAGASCSFYSGIFALLTIIFLLFANDDFNVVMLSVLGAFLQIVSIAGNLFSVWWTFRKHQIIKSGLQKIKETGEIDNALWDIVEKQMGHYKLTVDAKYGPVQSGVDIADVTIKGVKSISSLSVVVALYPLRVVSSFTGVWRLISITLRSVAALTLVLYIIIIIFDVIVLLIDMIEIAVYIHKSFPRHKLSKTARTLKHTVDQLTGELESVKEVFDELIERENNLINQKLQKDQEKVWNECSEFKSKTEPFVTATATLIQ